MRHRADCGGRERGQAPQQGDGLGARGGGQARERPELRGDARRVRIRGGRRRERARTARALTPRDERFVGRRRALGGGAARHRTQRREQARRRGGVAVFQLPERARGRAEPPRGGGLGESGARGVRGSPLFFSETSRSAPRAGAQRRGARRTPLGARAGPRPPRASRPRSRRPPVRRARRARARRGRARARGTAKRARTRRAGAQGGAVVALGGALGFAARTRVQRDTSERAREVRRDGRGRGVSRARVDRVGQGVRRSAVRVIGVRRVGLRVGPTTRPPRRRPPRTRPRRTRRPPRIPRRRAPPPPRAPPCARRGPRQRRRRPPKAAPRRRRCRRDERPALGRAVRRGGHRRESAAAQHARASRRRRRPHAAELGPPPGARVRAVHQAQREPRAPAPRSWPWS